MNSLFGITVLATIFLMSTRFRDARGRPSGERYTECSVRLNRLAQDLAKDILEGSPTEQFTVKDGVVVVEASDMCSPMHLRINATQCLRKIAVALKNYTRLFGEKGLFQGSEWTQSALAAAGAASELHELVQSRLEVDESKISDKKEPLLDGENEWMLGNLRRYGVERLLSFSILTARVFAAGDPENHGKGPFRICTLE